MRVTVFFLLANLFCIVKCSRILVVFPAVSRSHFILGNALARGLAEAGHEVTLISAHGDKDPPKNGRYRDVVLTGALEEHKKLNFIDFGKMPVVLTMLFMSTFSGELARKTLDNPNFKKLIESDEHFDVVIMEAFLNDALKALSDHYKAPLIMVSTMGATSLVNPIVGNPAPPSYVPEMLLEYVSPMSFWQRLRNFIYASVWELIRSLIFLPIQNKIMKEYFPNAPDISTLDYNVSLVLLNSHESITEPVPHVPKMVQIGGYHLRPPKELPTDLKEFMDNAKEGVVYFSMGSNVIPSDIPKEITEAILNGFGKIKQKVLWKWNQDTLPGKPDNVKISTWFPQQEILAHPNTKLFITHGGLLSTTETIYHGVPILAIPIAGDQKMNAALAEKNGIGIKLTLEEITEEKLSSALDKLLNDPKYRDAVKIRSQLMHDRPVKPLDLAVYWVEFIIRHKGAHHLRVAALDLTWYQYLLLDVVAFIGVSAIIFLVITYVVLKRLCCSSKNSKAKLKKN